MVSLPASQTWMYVRNCNSALVKRKEGTGWNLQLTAEKGSVMSVSAFKYSGLANEKTIAIDIGADGKVTMGLKAPKNATKPRRASTWRRSKNFRRVAKSIKTQTAGKYAAATSRPRPSRGGPPPPPPKVQAGVAKKAKTKTGRKKNCAFALL
ncbi:hypothetical protein JL721_9487 [Aureococcus anophagefferens]|nr:hypothetical protein JL721_9487 [Aureococcus anophagefferens]